MKIGIITDNHFGVRGSSTYFIDNFRKFYSAVFFPTLKDRGIDIVLMGGDTWEDRRTISVNALHEARKMFFDPAEAAGIQIHAILGNHDVAFRNTNEINSMSIVEAAYKNVNVIFDTQEFKFGSTSIAMISWINNQNYASKINFIKNCKSDVLFGHFEIKNFEMTPGHFCETGLDADLFREFDQVWSGHFHIKSNIGNIQYLGNPSQTSWGDCGFTKGFHIFDTETRELEFIENPYNVYERIQYDDKKISLSAFPYEDYKDKIVIVYVKNLIETNNKKLNLFMDKLNQYVKEATVDQLDKYSNDNELEIDHTYLSTIEVIDKYITETVDNEQTRKIVSELMSELHKEALTMSDIE